jgi:short subunit fatty acids transporter
MIHKLKDVSKTIAIVSAYVGLVVTSAGLAGTVVMIMAHVG